MQSFFTERLETGIFTIDFEKENKCKGTVMVEVQPLKSDEKLILNSNQNEVITRQNPFKIETSFPIVHGELTFKPYESHAKMKTVVRFLFVK